MTVAVIGWGWRTPLGAAVEEATGRLLAGERAARPSARFDTTSYAVGLGASIPGAPAASRNERFVRRVGLWGMEAAREAFAGSGARPGERLGLFAAVGGVRAHWDELLPALVAQEPEGPDAWQRGFRLLHPFWMLRYLSNNAHALLAVEQGAKGDGAVFGGAVSGSQAISSAARALEGGATDAALVVAYDSHLEPETLVELGARRAATRADLAGLRAPYDDEAAGFVPGEAAAALVLVRPEDAGTRALAWLDAASGADGEAGEPRATTISTTLARVARADRVVDGAGLGIPAFDAAEREAVARVVGEQARLVCTSSATGQLGAASPLVQVIALAGCLRRGMLPPIAGLRRAARGPLVPVTHATRTDARSAVAIAAGAPGLVGVVRVEVPDV